MNSRWRGRLSPPQVAFCGSVVVLAALIGVLAWDARQSSPRGTAPLVVYCAAGLRLPVAAIARDYEQEFGVTYTLGGAYDLLERLGYSCLAPRPLHEKANPVAVEQFKQHDAPFL